ncbi:hypothetical protein SDC9_131953 [bioreactor metagenome]|uniref:Uncharacterized protein n=1 Tax=bioreactor metagenome TaxID=1076179 RepID=A0A645D6S2_9ZZZZ
MSGSGGLSTGGVPDRRRPQIDCTGRMPRPVRPTLSTWMFCLVVPARPPGRAGVAPTTRTAIARTGAPRTSWRSPAGPISPVHRVGRSPCRRGVACRPRHVSPRCPPACSWGSGRTCSGRWNRSPLLSPPRRPRRWRRCTCRLAGRPPGRC